MMRTNPYLSPESALSNRSLRVRLMRNLLTDAELEAFCIDHFPATQQFFTCGMDRQQKLNLLLAREAPSLINEELSKIEQRAMPAEASSVADPAKSAPTGLERSAGTALGILYPLIAVSLLFLWSIGEFASSGVPRMLRQPALPLNGETAAHAAIMTASEGASVRDLRLLTEPDRVQIIDLQTGQDLGTTPWDIDLTRLPLDLCLRRSGYYDKAIRIDVDNPIDIPVRLKAITSAQRESALAKEDCDVPLPVVKK